ncbi:hypothetical protein CJU90_4691 [Yarrowia sp. C11]|nr:hypothetical protein CJU90_4691 [Yarrowia sp. C11]KAG5370628.1 hypothetical protein CKK34_0740 [Yarrowia sp. E02]
MNDDNDVRSPGLSSSCSSAMTSHTGTPLLAEASSSSTVPPMSLDAFNEKLLINPSGEEQVVLSCATQSHVATRSRRRYDVDVFFDRQQTENSQGTAPTAASADKPKGKQPAVESIPPPLAQIPAVSLFPATNMNQFDSKSEEYIPLLNSHER